jgi:UDPglucose 6-dehydrogenase
VVVHDPVAIGNCRAILGEQGIGYTDDLETALDGADAVVMVTSWPQYQRVPELVEGRDTVVLDGRRMLTPASVPRYDGIGYPG